MFFVAFLFWFFLIALLYTYLGYGLLISLLIRFGSGRNQDGVRQEKAFPTPGVFFIITAYNEERVIGDKIANSLSLRYPSDRLRICVVADGSTDDTVAIASRHEGVLVLHAPSRLGKAAAMNRAVEQAGAAEVLVFSDANTLLEPDSLLMLVRRYANPSVGAVSGEKKVSAGRAGSLQAVGESMYWRYESRMKVLDARFHTLVGAAGELLSVRRDLYRPIPEDTILDDLHLSLGICLQGHVVDYEPAAVAMEEASTSIGQEWERKVRIAAGAFQALSRSGRFLLPWPDARLWLQFVSRRFMRWVVCPLALPVLLVTNAVLALKGGTSVEFYRSLLLLQLSFHAMALVGGSIRRSSHPVARVFQLPFYFLFMHYSLWVGFIRWAGGGQPVNWTKATRSPGSI